MGVRESLLNTITSVADSDFVRIVTSAGASSKATVANLAKAIIENYAGSSLGGSVRSVKSAIDTIKSSADSIASTVSTHTSQIDSLNSKTPTMMGGSQVTITDTTYGFIDTGISSANYIILAAYTLLNANNVCLISNLNGGNYRVQIMSATNQAIAKSGTYRIYYWVMPR